MFVAFFFVVSAEVTDHFRIAFYEGKRRFEVVWNIGYQFCFKIVGFFKLLGGHGQGGSKFIDFRIARAFKFDAVVSFCQLFEVFVYFVDGSGDPWSH